MVVHSKPCHLRMYECWCLFVVMIARWLCRMLSCVIVLSHGRQVLSDGFLYALRSAWHRAHCWRGVTSRVWCGRVAWVEWLVWGLCHEQDGVYLSKGASPYRGDLSTFHFFGFVVRQMKGRDLCLPLRFVLA